MRVGMLTSGGDCPGLNAVIRSAVLHGIKSYDMEMVGIRNGWSGLIEKDVEDLPRSRVRGLARTGGTILGTSRTHPYNAEGGGPENMLRNLRELDIDAVIAIGGEGTLAGANRLAADGLPIVGVPKTIDNDLQGTDYTFGFDTAVQIATDAMDRLRTTGESHHRCMVAEVMGRHVGWIALHAGMAGGAHYTVIPEEPFDIAEICKAMERRFQMGEKYGIIVVAEGATPKEGTMDAGLGEEDEFGHKTFNGMGQIIGDEVKKRLGYDVRTTVLGHTQRGGTPTAYDRVLATRYGVHAARAAHEGNFGSCVALHGEDIELVALEDAVAHLKTVPERRYTTAKAMFT